MIWKILRMSWKKFSSQLAFDCHQQYYQQNPRLVQLSNRRTIHLVVSKPPSVSRKAGKISVSLLKPPSTRKGFNPFNLLQPPSTRKGFNPFNLLKSPSSCQIPDAGSGFSGQQQFFPKEME